MICSHPPSMSLVFASRRALAIRGPRVPLDLGQRRTAGHRCDLVCSASDFGEANWFRELCDAAGCPRMWLA
jgi:hypothetical protein